MSGQSASSPAEATLKNRRTKRRSSQSGFSLLARGEPQIWFTGGMLVICLVMIVGLLSFILYAGLPTFWPRQVQWLVLNDGSFEIGQPQATQRGAAGDSPSPAGIEQSVEVTDDLSRYYRTGNVDLTGRHYRWISPWELDESGLTRPTWGMVVERLENGRLYGILGQLSISIGNGAQIREQLAELDELGGLIASLPDVSVEVQSAVSTAIAERSQELLSNALWEAASASAQQKTGEVQAKTAEQDQWQSIGELPDGAPLLAVRRLITNKSEVLRRLQEQVASISILRKRAEAVGYQISRLDSRVSELRAEVRRAEIRTDTLVAEQPESSHYLIEQLESLNERLSVAGEREALLEKIIGDRALSKAALAAFADYASLTLPQQIADLESQIEMWLAPVREQPLPLVEAMQAYLAGYRRIVAEKKPLQAELEQLEQELSLAEVSFLLPVTPTRLDLVDAELELLKRGEMGEALRQQLLQLAIDAVPESIELSDVGEHLQLATFVDVGASQHALAISDYGYLPGSPQWGQQVTLLSQKSVGCREIVRAIPANQLSLSDKAAVYFSRWREFLVENPREANTEGGVFPAIWGTIVMTLIMTIAVVPFGVMAALYLREYTRAGLLVSIIRISINNLAGVPSIVYGVFGFSFFCYTVGAFIDGGAKNADLAVWPSKIWFLAVAVVAILGTIAFFFSFLSSGPSHTQTSFKRWAARGALILWLLSVAGMVLLIMKSPFFDGFYREYLPNPTFGKGGLLWASLTLSLLTLPVVIVATEEALAAVPNSLREGSLACGASKWQTIRRIILPHARPGILTGAILAMARGAGEVAPLMLVGALASAPDLPLDSEFPFFHGSRSFMHLGYQIYTLGFQSQNSEAAKPMVFTCTLLLILIVAALNISAIYLRGRLKRQFQGNQF